MISVVHGVIFAPGDDLLDDFRFNLFACFQKELSGPGYIMPGFNFIYRETLGKFIKRPVLIGKNFGEKVALAAAKKIADVSVLLDYRSEPFFKSRLLVIKNS
jgi:hypothetical protein